MICTCLFKNNQKWFSSSFDCLTPRIQFINHPLDVHIYSPSENVLCDSFRLWHYLPLYLMKNVSKVCLQILVLFHFRYCWLLLSISYLFDKGHNDILSQRFLNVFLVDVNGQNTITLICVTWNILSLRLIYFRLPRICSVSHHKIGILWAWCREKNLKRS